MISVSTDCLIGMTLHLNFVILLAFIIHIASAAIRPKSNEEPTSQEAICALARRVRSYDFLDPQQEARDDPAMVGHEAAALKGDYRLLLPLAFSF